MNRRPIAAVLVGAAVLLAVLNLLVYSLYHSGRQTVARALEDRLDALGRTTARLLAGAADRDAILRGLVEENGLEDAYLFDASFRTLAGARTPAGSRLNLLRVDVARAQAALERQRSVAPGYDVSGVRIDAGYFPVATADGPAVLALEAGAEFRAPEARLATTFWTAVAVSAVLGAGFLLVATRSFRAHGRAERLAVVGQMAAMVAHEVRNPLGILRAQAELLAERAGPVVAPRERERLGEILAEIDRLNVLTDEFLALARDPPLEPDACDVAALLQKTVERIRRDPAAAAARIDVAAPADGLAVRADRAKIEQAVFNLIRNAVQIGGPGVAVTVGAAVADGAVRISVADDGPGIPPQLRGSLFEPFVGARSGGSGLGLAIARRVVERHGGRLVLDPAPHGGRGAAFSMYLPLAETS